MRSFLLAPLLALLAGCGAPLPSQLALSANARASIQVRLTPPPPPKPAVALEGAPVVEFFGIPLDDAQDVVFVLDVSGSMSGSAQGRLAELGPSEPASATEPATAERDEDEPAAPTDDPNAAPVTGPSPTPSPRRATKLEVAQEELVAALEQLPEGTRLNIVFFSDGVEAVAPTLVPLGAQRTSLIDYVRSTRPLTSTALVPAMRTAMMLSARRIVLLSDGHGNVGGHDGELLRDAREAMRGGLRIDTIGLGGGQDTALLSTLATESGGLYQSF